MIKDELPKEDDILNICRTLRETFSLNRVDPSLAMSAMLSVIFNLCDDINLPVEKFDGIFDQFKKNYKERVGEKNG